MQNNIVLIMAAGEGTRMKSNMPKVMHRVGGRPMIDCVIDAGKGATDRKPVVIVGSRREIIMSYLGESVDFALQDEQQGTGHAVMMAREYLKDVSGQTIVIAGDMPLLRARTIEKLCQEAEEKNYAATILTSIMRNPTGYGRIKRLSDYTVGSIVEEADADDEDKGIKEVNTSVYCFDTKSLLECLDKLDNNNKQGEYYLTDCISNMVAQGLRVGAMAAPEDECMGVNDRVQLAQAEKVMRERTSNALLNNGVSMVDPENTYIDSRAKVGRDTIIYPNVIIEGECTVGKGCIIYPGTRIHKSNIGNNVIIDSSVILKSEVSDSTNIGPFAYIRPDSFIGEGSKIGDFVEIKNAKISKGAKVPHLSYIGDGQVGEGTNIGCGSIFANYDGKNKHQTTVGDNCFIGCNSTLVAPVKVEDGAFIAAGSTITEDVPKDALALGRNKQENKADWVKKRKEQGKL